MVLTPSGWTGICSAKVNALVRGDQAAGRADSDVDVGRIRVEERENSGMGRQTIDEVATQVHNYVVEQFLFGQGGESLSNDTSFLESAIIDSTGVLEIIAFIEERFGITVKDDELVPDNLDSVKKIAGFVDRKLGAAAG